jgi:hypothetical protein
MRNTINLGLYALAASSIAQAEDSQGQQTDVQLLKDIDAVSRYWGAFSQQIVFPGHC